MQPSGRVYDGRVRGLTMAPPRTTCCLALALPWVTFSAMTDVAQASVESLGLVERVAALHRVELFAGIPGRVLAAVAEGRRREAPLVGEVLMEEGAVEAHLYAIVEGRVQGAPWRSDPRRARSGRDGGRARRAGARSAHRVGDRAGADARPARRPGGARRASRRLARARPRRDRGARIASARDDRFRRPGVVSDTPERGVIALLTAQALAFGVMLALVVIPANAIFLDAYGAKWLPATYIAIAVFGTGASAFIARAARRTRLVRVATVSLSASPSSTPRRG